MRDLLRLLGTSFLHLIYPPLCLHCEESLEAGASFFCSSCLSLLDVIDPRERCCYCFTATSHHGSPQEPHERLRHGGCCKQCRDEPSLMQAVASVFDYEGPAASLVKEMKYGGRPYLAEGAGAFLVAQLMRLEWPLPDVLVPMPMSFLKKFDRGYNQAQLLAQAMGRLLDRPVVSVLKRSLLSYSQAALSHQQRLLLSEDAVKAIATEELHDKCVLLVDDVMTTGTSLKRCSEALTQLYPHSIYALTFCRAM